MELRPVQVVELYDAEEVLRCFAVPWQLPSCCAQALPRGRQKIAKETAAAMSDGQMRKRCSFDYSGDTLLASSFACVSLFLVVYAAVESEPVSSIQVFAGPVRHNRIRP